MEFWRGMSWIEKHLCWDLYLVLLIRLLMSVDIFTAVDATGTYTVNRNTFQCSCTFNIENGMPCRHILAYCAHSNTDVNVQSICDRWLQSEISLTHIAIENYFPVQLRQPSLRNSVHVLVRQLSEEQCSSAMFHRFCAHDPSPNVRAVNCPMCGAITNS